MASRLLPLYVSITSLTQIICREPDRGETRPTASVLIERATVGTMQVCGARYILSATLGHVNDGCVLHVGNFEDSHRQGVPYYGQAEADKHAGRPIQK